VGSLASAAPAPPPVIRLVHSRVEYTREGVRGGVGSHVVVENSSIRHTQGRGLHVGDNGTVSITGSVVDSACLSLCGTNDAAVVILGFMSVRFADNDILNSGAAGLLIPGTSQISVFGGGRIEGSAGTGLVIRERDARPVLIDTVLPLRITGGAGYPAELPIAVAAQLLNSHDAHAAWTGNAQDTVLVAVHGSRVPDSLSIFSPLPWRIFGSSMWLGFVGELLLHPGARLVLSDRLRVHTMTSVGSAAEAVTIIAVPFGGEYWGAGPRQGQLVLGGGGGSRLVHSRFEGIQLEAFESTVFDLVTSVDGHVRVAAAGSRIENSRFVGVRDGHSAPLLLAATGITVASCEITGSTGDGIRAEVALGVTVTHCDIHGNAGPGIRNTAAEVLDARHNWWGSAAGPHGADGDGVAGNVDFEPFRTTRAFPGTAVAAVAR
jgi:hypothetical protein